MNPDRELDSALDGHVRVPTAARRLGMTTRQLYERIDRGELAAVKDRKGMVVIPEAELPDPDD